MIEIKIINERPIQFMSSKERILQKIRAGKLIKGILKKWLLYVIISED